ncbi:MAG TPA: hypothetical protein VGG55_02805, partial [Candidatus Acidoferrales bacterium]
EVLPAFDAAAGVEIEPAAEPKTGEANSEVEAAEHPFGAAAEFEASASEVKDHADSDVAHEQFAATIDEVSPQLDASSAPDPALNLAPEPTFDAAFDSAPGPGPDSAPEVALEVAPDLDFDRTSDPTSEATPGPSAYDESAAPDSAVEGAPATPDPAWHLSKAVEEWESTIAAIPTAEPESLAETEAPPELDAVREPVEVTATEPERAPEVELESRTSADADSESQPVPEVNVEPEVATEPQADSYAVSSVVTECDTNEHVPDAVVAAQEIVADDGARHEFEAEQQPEWPATSAAAPESEIHEHIPEPVPAAQNFVAEDAPSIVSAEEPPASGFVHESTHEESGVAHDAPSEPAESDPLHQPLVDTPWTSLHWSAALQDCDVLPDAILPATPETSAPEVSTPSESERDDDVAIAHSKAPDVQPAAIQADVHEALPADNAAAIQEPLTPEEIEATVTQMLERMQPKVAELLTREILRPIIEALVRGELSKR